MGMTGLKMLVGSLILLVVASGSAAQISRFRLLMTLVGEVRSTDINTTNNAIPDNNSSIDIDFNSDMKELQEMSSVVDSERKLTEAEREWLSFKREYKKQYFTQAEEEHRQSVYFANKKLVEEHNERAQEGKETYTKGLNHLADLTQEEFYQQYLGGVGDMRFEGEDDQIAEESMEALPSYWNWNDHGAVVGVKNQGSCGSCWTFSTAGSLETLNYRKTKKLVSFSEQQILDCASNRKYGNQGCGGGWPTKALKYVMDAGGIETSARYPYLGYQTYCRMYNKPTGGKCRGFVKAQAGNEGHMKYYIAMNGTMSVLVNAGDWQFYRSGVYNHPYCKYSAVNHAVLLTGYGTNYWIIKNSWSRGWGEAGYIKLARNVNMCGVASSAVIPY